MFKQVLNVALTNNSSNSNNKMAICQSQTNNLLQESFPEDYDSFVRSHFNHNFYIKTSLSIQHGDDLTYLDGLLLLRDKYREIEGNIQNHRCFAIKYSVKNGLTILKYETVTSLFSFHKFSTVNKFLLNFSKELDSIKEFV